MAVTFPAAPHQWESRGLLSLGAAFSFWFILFCCKAEDKREGHCLQLPADPEGLAFCWDPSRWDALYFQQQLFQCQDLLLAKKQRGPCCCQAFSAISCFRRGESSEDGASVLGAVTAELFAVPKVLHALVFFQALGRRYWRKNEWILGNKSGGSVIVGLNWCSRGEKISFWILQRLIARGALSCRRVDSLLLLMQRTVVSDSFCQPWISFKRLCDSCSVSAVCISGNLIVTPWISCPEYVRVHFAVL